MNDVDLGASNRKLRGWTRLAIPMIAAFFCFALPGVNGVSAAIFVVSNTGDSGPGSLREAISSANSAPGPDMVAFDIPPTDPSHGYYLNNSLSGSLTFSLTSTTVADDALLTNPDPDHPYSLYRIALAAPLPAITDPVTIDGYTQGQSTGANSGDDALPNTNSINQGLNTRLRIELDGSNAGFAATAIQLAAGSGGSTIKGLAIKEFHGDDFSPGQGILVVSDNNHIEGNFVGSGVDGITRSLNTHGIQVLGANNVIGGTTPAARNLISGNNRTGLLLNAGVGGHTVQGNIIGLRRTGVIGMGNFRDGILVLNSPDNVIGGTDPNARNICSGNGYNGIAIVLAPARNNTVQGNFIGTDVTGTVSAPNNFHGIYTYQSPVNILGGTASGAGNLISGNLQAGITLEQSGGNIIRGNTLGSDLGGAVALANGFSGILIYNSSATTVGGSTAAANRVAFNTTGGVIVAGSGGGNRIQANSIFSNGGLGIDLSPVLGANGVGDGVTANDDQDSDEGINRLQNFPVITDVQVGATLDVTYFVDSNPSSSAFPIEVEFYLTDPSGQEGRTFLGSDSYSASDGSKLAMIAPLAPVAAGNKIVATATDGEGNTSEFSAAFLVGGVASPTIVVVNNTGDAPDLNALDGVCSTGNMVGGAPECTLRAAIAHANATANADLNTPDEIHFGIPPTDGAHYYYADDSISDGLTLPSLALTTEADDGMIAGIDPDYPHSFFRIRPATVFPQITQPLIIDGYTQTGASANTNPVGQGLNTVLRIEIDAESTGNIPNGLLRVSAGKSVIKGLNINRYGGVAISLVAAGGDRVEGNFLGTDISGLVKFPDPGGGFTLIDRAGVLIESFNCVVGGLTPERRNLVSAAFRANAVKIEGINNSIQGNLIGPNRTGMAGFSNALAPAIEITAFNNTVGGAAAGAQNVISANYAGVVIRQTFGAGAPPATGNIISHNLIGTDLTGTAPLGNYSQGIDLEAGGTIIDANTLAFNETGVQISDFGASHAQGNLITQNSIFSNSGLGIDLNADSLSFPQDGDDADTSANNTQNFPVLTAVTSAGATTHVEGFLQSTPSSDFRLEFFSNAERDPAGAGEGEVFLESRDLSLDATGQANFSYDLAAPAPGQKFISATATDLTIRPPAVSAANDTSEFSFAFPIDGCLDTIVTNTLDGGAGSLREAIYCANALSGVNTVGFNIPGSGPHEIAIASTLPTVYDPVIIDGFTQGQGTPGDTSDDAVPNTNPVGQGLNAILKVVIKGFPLGPDNYVIPALMIQAGSSTVRGLVLNGQTAGAAIELAGAGGNVVAGNYIGTDINGSTSVPNDDGIVVGSDGNWIGGIAPSDRNLISGNNLFGIDLVDANSNVVQGNLIGVTADGGNPLGNSDVGIRIVDSANNLIGGAIAGAANVISANGGAGLAIAERDSDGNIVQGNFVGVDVTGTLNLGNQDEGIGVFAGLNNKIGGTEPGAGNVVAFNGGGVVLDIPLFGGFAQLTPILGNRIFSNSFLGIDLTADDENDFYVNPNDDGPPPDQDDGPNHLQNYPVLTGVISGSGLSILGELRSVPETDFRIEFFSNDSADASGYGQGQELIGSINVTTDASGMAVFNAPFPGVNLASSQKITSTATRLDGVGVPLETSEFSAVLPLCPVQDVADFILGKTSTPPPCGDVNGDGVVDAADIVPLVR